MLKNTLCKHLFDELTEVSVKKPIKKLIVIFVVALLFMTSVVPVSATDGPDAKLSSEVLNVMDAENETGFLSPTGSGDGSEETSDVQSGQEEDTGEPDSEAIMKRRLRPKRLCPPTGRLLPAPMINT